MLDDATIATFRDLIDTEFTISSAEGDVVLVLVEVQPLGHPRPGAREPFSLMFRGPATPLLQQGTHSFAAELWTGEIFIVPVARDPEGAEYQAIFT